MRERGKAMEAYNNKTDMEYYYSSASDLPCRKHPSASSVGICAYCLKDRLLNLVCSDCGEQRLSSCSCSDLSPNRNSCTGDVGSVGRVSFLIETERNEIPIVSLSSNSKPPNKSHEKTEEVMIFRRSNSSCVEINKKSNGFWKLGKLFRKKKEKDYGTKSVAGFDEKSEIFNVDQMGMSRSRSLCSFRNGGGWFGSEDCGDLMVSGARSSISGPRSSSVTEPRKSMALDSGRRSGFSEAEPRKSMALESGRRSGFSEAEPRKSMALESGRRSGFSEAEPRKSMALESGRRSGFSEAEPRKSMALESGRRSGFSDAEPRKSMALESGRRSGFSDDTMVSELGCDFKGLKKIGYVDVDGGFSGASRRVFSLRESDFNGMDDSSFIDLKLDYTAESKSDYSVLKMGSKLEADIGFGSMRAGYGGSCRITVNDRGINKKGRKSFKGWRWIFRHNPSLSTSRKKDEDIMFKT